MVIIKYVVSMGLYFIFLLALVEFFRKHVKIAHFAVIGSLFTLPLWIIGGMQGWFRWAKNLSVILPTIFVGITRIAYTSPKTTRLYENLRKHWVLVVLYGVLFLNILEATIKDVALGNYMNAICGALLCVTIPLPFKRWKFSQDTGDLLAYTAIGWNFMYTTWNACFVYGEGATFFASSLVILLAAELYPVFKKRHELYIMARIYTLATHLVIRSSFPNLFPTVMNASTWFNPAVLKAWGTINIVLMVLFVIYEFGYKRYKTTI
ncbi:MULTISPECIES: hypothetical protein [unclassified Fusibacter]|uniref:hypothetical protein n=1 Tax=unclassified Fusibacter TaxID=2624464 RepID=UPI0010137336|nr:MULTISPECIES: hypothetical protein [unclassified Fusibacter]MCK8058588.1 hypothetical protein [Fusibacter sp. A2]NPE22642.1 hypothetical protein [Fusibacter sp. A1]RXV60206.1 hypothetical protein DWB64_12395 [Fusibacter sp. A1]